MYHLFINLSKQISLESIEDVLFKRIVPSIVSKTQVDMNLMASNFKHFKHLNSIISKNLNKTCYNICFLEI